MNNETFTRYVGLARVIGGEYAAGYLTGIRARYHGKQFTLPAPHEVLGDESRYGERARGFNDGISGRMPTMASEQEAGAERKGTIQFEVPMGRKSAWVRGARRDGMKLVPWIITHLDKAASDERD